MNPQLHGRHGLEKHCVSWKLRTEGTKCVGAAEGWWQPWRPALGRPWRREPARGRRGGLSACRRAGVRPQPLPPAAPSPALSLSRQGAEAWLAPPNAGCQEEATFALDGAPRWASQNFSELHGSQSAVLPPLLRGRQTYFIVPLLPLLLPFTFQQFAPVAHTSH